MENVINNFDFTKEEFFDETIIDFDYLEELSDNKKNKIQRITQLYFKDLVFFIIMVGKILFNNSYLHYHISLYILL